MLFLGTFIYRLFFLIYSGMALAYFFDLLSPSSAIFNYYQLLRYFEPSFSLLYWYNLFTALLNLVCLIPFFLVAFNKSKNSHQIWKWIFVLRLMCDLSGRNFEWQFVKSTFYAGPQTMIFLLLSILLFHLPSYLAHFQHAFCKNHS